MTHNVIELEQREDYQFASTQLGFMKDDIDVLIGRLALVDNSFVYVPSDVIAVVLRFAKSLLHKGPVVPAELAELLQDMLYQDVDLDPTIPEADWQIFQLATDMLAAKFLQ